jgi:hypothetical protein
MKLVEFDSFYRGQRVKRYVNPGNVLFVGEMDDRGKSIIVFGEGNIIVKGAPSYIASLLGVKHD